MASDTATPAAPEPVAEEALPHTKFSVVVDRVINAFGAIASWLWVLIIVAIVVNVVWRYALRSNIGQLEELQWHLYAVAFLIGLSFTVVADQHVRVDIVYGQRSLRAKAWVDLIGILVFALPFVLLVIWYGWPFVEAAYVAGERSDQPSGLPYRFLIKAALPASFILLLAAFLSRLSRVTSCLFGFPTPIEPVRRS